MSTTELTLTVDCPECGCTVTLGAALSGVLTIDDDGKYLRAKVKSRPMVHWCGQPELPVDAAEPDLALFDHAERAAGEAVARGNGVTSR